MNVRTYCKVKQRSFVDKDTVVKETTRKHLKSGSPEHLTRTTEERQTEEHIRKRI